jgi:hypothetical protein
VLLYIGKYRYAPHSPSNKQKKIKQCGKRDGETVYKNVGNIGKKDLWVVKINLRTMRMG